MNKKFSNIEELFKDSFENHKVEANPIVLRNLKRKLWWSDFFSFNPIKLNFVYATLTVAGIIATPLFLTKPANDNTEVIPETTPEISITSTQPQTIIKKSPEEVNTENKTELAETIVEEQTEALFNLSVSKGCVPLSVALINRSLNAKSYLWDFGDGTTSKLINPKHIYNSAGLYTITLTITDKDGNTDTKSKSIDVLGKPAADLAIDISNSEIDTRKISFKNLSENAVSYKWLFGDNMDTEEEQPVHTYNDYGIYRVKLICTSENGCSDTAVLVNKFIDKNYKLAFPLTFRPNPSSANNKGFYESANEQGSVFYPKNFGAKSYQLEIYTGNGIKVFTSENIKQGWNGFVRGRMAPAGMYKYIAKGVYPNNKPFNVTGSFKVVNEAVFDNY